MHGYAVHTCVVDEDTICVAGGACMMHSAQRNQPITGFRALRVARRIVCHLGPPKRIDARRDQYGHKSQSDARLLYTHSALKVQ